MTKYIDILFASPPDVEFPQLVDTVDDRGAKTDVGEWIKPDGENPFWRYRLRPAELLLEMIEEEGRMDEPRAAKPRLAAVQNDADAAPLTDAQSRRRALREKVLNAPRKERSGQPAAEPEPSGTPRQKCPGCEKSFNPAKHELIACPACGEEKCTAICIPAAGDPCLDCQALSATPEEGGYDPTLAGDAEGSFSGRLFDGVYHGKGGDQSGEDDDAE